MLYPHLYIETERLYIRPFTLADIEPSYEMNLDSEVSKYTGDGGIVSRHEIERRITEDVLGDYKKHGYGRLAVVLKAENKFIGFTGLKYLEDFDEVDLGFRYLKAYWGKGLATEAAKASLKLGFETLGLTKIIAMVLPENLKSIRVLEKLKFNFEREAVEDGERVNIYAVLKSDFKLNIK